MPRNVSGTYSLPAGNPVVNGTNITITWANNTLNDIAAEMTDSLSRSGEGAMLAPLQVPDGSAAAPSVTFSNDTDGGMYRVGANDVGLAAGGTQAAHFTATSFAVTLAMTASVGVTITQSTSNAAALTVTGNGSGDGIVATGGGTDGDGGTFTGGASNGRGVVATGDGTGDGVVATGGDNSGDGITATGGATNGNGVVAQGTGSGAGVNSTGGSSNAIGVVGTGGGTGTGGQFANGTAAEAGTRRTAVALTNGDLSLAGVVNAASTTAFTNVLSTKNLVKAWARVQTNGAAGITILDGFNVASASISGAGNTLFNVAVADDMADVNGGVIATINMAANDRFIFAQLQAVGNIQGEIYDISGAAALDLNATIVNFTVLLMGAQ